MKHIIDIELNDDEEKLIDWLREEAKQNKHLGCYKPSKKEILRDLLNLQIWEEIQINADDAGISR